jgi:hypothetical protein
MQGQKNQISKIDFYSKKLNEAKSQYDKNLALEGYMRSVKKFKIILIEEYERKIGDK